MVRILDLSDCSHLYEQLINIWQEAFADSKEAICDFFREVGNHTKVVICEKSGRIVSATYLLPITYMQKNKTPLDCYYLYAAATARVDRGCGYFGQILQFIQERIHKPVILVPASMSLVDYYKGHGFEVWLTENQNAIAKLEAVSAKPISKETYCTFRREILNKPYSMMWDEKMLRYICDEHKKAGGHFAEAYIDNTHVVFMCIGGEKDWSIPEMFSVDERFCITPTVMANKPFYEVGKGYFNLTMD